MAKLGFIEQNFGLKLTEQTCLILKKLPYDPDFVSILHLVVTLSKFKKNKYCHTKVAQHPIHTA